MKYKLEQEASANLSTLANMDTAWLLMYAVGKIASGFLVDFFRPKHIMCFGGMLAAMACIIYDPSLPESIQVFLWGLNGAGQW